jgi:N-hydroxyarylamine O-acetyltransferase
MNPSELERYFARVGYRGPREATLPVLHALTAAHSKHIPFENGEVLLGRGVDLDDAAVFDKLVERQRGGYCFEQNGLFLRVLTTLGFEVTPFAARVRIGRPREYIPARTHMFLRVVLDGVVWLTDVGVGALSLTAAIRFELDTEQETPHEARRIQREGDRYFHQARLGDAWTDVYDFTGEPMPRIDREVGNWYTSTHPQSHFRHDLIVARADDDGRRRTLSSSELKIRGRDGRAQVTAVESPEHLLELLSKHFGLKFAAGTRFESGAPRSESR